MTEQEKLEMAKAFFRQVFLLLEDACDDEIYAEIDPDGEFGEELPQELNLETIREILRMGFVAKYGTSLGM